MALNFCAEETAFIFTAQLLLFLAIVYIRQLSKAEWGGSGRKKILFQFLVGLALLSVITSLTFSAFNPSTMKANTTGGAGAPEAVTVPAMGALPSEIGTNIILGLALVSACAAAWVAVNSLGWKGIRSSRSFDLLMLVGTLILPLLVAFPIKLAHLDPLDYSNMGLVRSGFFLIIVAAISIGLGIWWRGKAWFVFAVIFYAVFTVFYTTFFTNGQGFFTEIIGSLGYWLTQQSVQRGSQPLYYYALIPIPIYEFLAAIGTILAIAIGVAYQKFCVRPGFWVSKPEALEDSNGIESSQGSNFNPSVPSLGLFIFMSVSALAAYSIAGKKMPWLTVYIILPMLLSAGWAFGFILEKTPWSRFRNIKVLLSDWISKEMMSLAGIATLAGLAVLTARAAYNANYINYDTAKEYLVYAHSAPASKDVLAQVEEISQRTTMGKDIVVAYDNDILYPFWWYFRDYPNKKWFGDKPTNDLKEAAVIISGDATMNKMAPIVKNNFIEYDYIRLWWPNQDYYDLTPERIWGAILNPLMRAGIFNIWLNRDYTLYAQVTKNQNLTLENWQPSLRMKMYIRKDIAAKIWNYGSLPDAQQPVQVDPYQGKIAKLKADLVVGTTGSAPGQFQAPRGMAAAPDGSIYVADSRNNRIQHFNSGGELLNIWGTFADISKGAAPGGTFDEPWGTAVGPDGSVYVTDTWNHRIEKFTPNGEFIKMWGTFGQGETPTAFWGPRGVAVDGDGRVYITDTGNKRVVIFNSEGLFITQFGTSGVDFGQLDEPVGLALDKSGKVYVNDTWNQRVQVFEPSADKTAYTPFKQWPINGWVGQSLDNKPFNALEVSGNVLVTDPEGYRVLEFDPNGAFVGGWGENSPDVDGFGLASGVVVAPGGKVWVSDGTNNRLLRFTLP